MGEEAASLITWPSIRKSSYCNCAHHCYLHSHCRGHRRRRGGCTRHCHTQIPCVNTVQLRREVKKRKKRGHFTLTITTWFSFGRFHLYFRSNFWGGGHWYKQSLGNRTGPICGWLMDDFQQIMNMDPVDPGLGRTVPQASVGRLQSTMPPHS